nr:MAG TPA: tail protein [Caudoviricetes sp.]
MGTIQQYRGKKAKLPTLLEAQFGFCTDTKELFIGSDSGNIPVVTGEKAETVAPLADTATLADVINKTNEIITKLKAAGLMK